MVVISLGMRMQFGSFELDDDRFELTRDGLAVALRPKVFDLLVVLVRERARVVRREEIFERLWSTTAVGFGSLAGLVNELRMALGESGRGPSSIRTVHARGYQFVAPVRSLDSEASGRETPGTAEERKSTQVARGAPAPDAGLRALQERLCTAADEVSRAGPRALVAPISTEGERSDWLASAARAASEAGFRPRFATAPGSGLLEDRGRRGGPREFDDMESDSEMSSGARPHRMRIPVALCLDVRDPDGWGRAGGLRRLLDLMGRTPVLVIAAFAANVGDPLLRELAIRDGRIRAASEPKAEGISDENGRSGSGDLEPDDLARSLRRLADADRAAFEVALRSLGFEAARREPIRNLRRVAATHRGSEGSLDREAL